MTQPAPPEPPCLFPYTVYRNVLGPDWAITTSKVAFPSDGLRSWLADTGWLCTALGAGVTAHHRTRAQHEAFTTVARPEEVGSFSAWHDTSDLHRDPSKLILTPDQLIGLAVISNHAQTAPLARLFDWLAAHDALKVCDFPGRDWRPLRRQDFFLERIITETTPATREYLTVYLRPLRGVFDLSRIAQRLAGYWGWVRNGDWHFLCEHAPELRWAQELDPSQGIGWGHPPALRVSAAEVLVFPGGMRGSNGARLNDFVQWLTTVWACGGREYEYSGKWPLGISVHHICPPVEAQPRWRHGFGRVAEDRPPPRGRTVLPILGAPDLTTVRSGVELVLALDDELLPWLLNGSMLGPDVIQVGSRLAGLPHSEMVVVMLILGSDCPMRSETAVTLRDLVLDRLPEGLQRLRSLRSLDLAGTWLPNPPAWLGEFTELEELSLEDNELTAVPQWLVKLEKLETLYLSDNPFPLGSWPAARAILERLPALERLVCIGIEAWDLDQVEAELVGVQVR